MGSPAIMSSEDDFYNLLMKGIKEKRDQTEPKQKEPEIVVPRVQPKRRTEREGYWKTHKYKRRSTMTIRYFCGWKTIERLVHKGKNVLIQALLATLFETGGRASEVLSLNVEQFRQKKDHLLIVGMTVLKQTKEENKYRQVPILNSDPLVPYMTALIEKRETGRLFPYGYDWLYKWVIKTDPNWWPHRFRAERASQLAVEKGFGVIELMKWFGWARESMATHYAKMSVEDLVAKMSRGEM